MVKANCGFTELIYASLFLKIAFTLANTMPHIIRLATQADRPAIEAIVHAAYFPYIARIGAKPLPMLADYAQLIKDHRVHVLEQDGLIQGLVVLIPEDDVLLLDNIAVNPTAHGKGYGRMLLDYAELQARAVNLPAIRLYTNAAMVENIAIYTKRGFHETHRAEEDGRKRVYMRKELA